MIEGGENERRRQQIITQTPNQKVTTLNSAYIVCGSMGNDFVCVQFYLRARGDIRLHQVKHASERSADLDKQKL